MSNERALPDWIEGFIAYTEDTVEADYIFRLWTAISCIASVMQRKCYLPWGPSLTFYPNMYIVLIGPPGCGKGTALGPGLDLLKNLSNVNLASNEASRQVLIKRMHETTYNAIDTLSGKHMFHASTTIFSSEFTVFLGYDNKELISNLCDWFDCPDVWEYDTISRSKEIITGMWVNLLAGTTPDLLQSSMNPTTIGGGLAARIVFVYSPKASKIIAIPPMGKKEQELYYHLLYDLEKIYCLSGRWSVTENFIDKWTEWRYYAAGENKFGNDTRLVHYEMRRKVHLMKLCMIMSASRASDPQMAITGDDFDRALSILCKAEERMPLVYSGVGRSNISEHMGKILAFLAEKPKGREIPMFEISRSFRYDLDKWHLDRVLETLEASKYIEISYRPQEGTFIKYLGGDADSI
jgi:hypothetical protein